MLSNYNFKLIKEFKLGEYNIPFIFSLDKIKAFPDQRPVYSGDSDKYSSQFVKEDIKNRLFNNFYSEGFYLILEEDLDLEWLSDFENITDYIIRKNKVFIVSKELFFEFLHATEEFEQTTINRILKFIGENETLVMLTFRERLLEDLEYYLENKTVGTDATHLLQWACGETSTNPNPFFPENLNKATLDWSWREIELRNLFKSKMFKIEQAIETLKAKMMEDIRKKNKK